MAPAVGVQLHGGFLSSLFVQAPSECLLNTYGSPSTGLAQCITLTCSCQKPLHFSPIMRQVASTTASLPFLQRNLELDMLYHIWYNMCMNDSLKILPARFFKTASGNESVREWLKDLDKDESRIIGGDIRKQRYSWSLGVAVWGSLTKDLDLWGGCGCLSAGGSSRVGFLIIGGGEDVVDEVVVKK